MWTFRYESPQHADEYTEYIDTFVYLEFKGLRSWLSLSDTRRCLLEQINVEPQGTAINLQSQNKFN